MASDFELLPAIDVLEDRVVRLERGDFERQTVFSDDPVEVASRFVDAGAKWLHVVDLDAARGGQGSAAAIGRLIEAVAGRACIDLGGGLRSFDKAVGAISRGADRVVIGTAALEDPGMVGCLISEVGPERVSVAVDVRDGRAQGDGWQSGATSLSPEALIDRFADDGVETFEVTAIDRDGVLGGPDLELLGRVVKLERGRI